MRKFLSCFGVLLIGVSGYCGVPTPTDRAGHTLTSIDWIGAETCVVGPGTGTNAVICTTGAAIGYGVIMSSIQLSSYFVFRDTGLVTVDTLVSTVTTIILSTQNTFNAAGAAGTGTTQDATYFYRFPVPIKFSRGISVTPHKFSVPTGGVFTILYRNRDPNEVE